MSGTMMPAARPTIDHGRLLTLERRAHFERLVARISVYGPKQPNAQPQRHAGMIEVGAREILSPRRIARRLYVLGIVDKKRAGLTALEVCDEIHRVMHDWVEGGYKTRRNLSDPTLDVVDDGYRHVTHPDRTIYGDHLATLRMFEARS